MVDAVGGICIKLWVNSDNVPMVVALVLAFNESLQSFSVLDWLIFIVLRAIVAIYLRWYLYVF